MVNEPSLCVRKSSKHFTVLFYLILTIPYDIGPIHHFINKEIGNLSKPPS